ncbi:UDP-3-O-(3-hydroxymyristoyl)glucosamine N-acyltransferase [bacterium]|nr:MAG: UDP-3-O-(3-hydroxymyristoyl)glucosamine N-acyltransferase [bacterium]
MRKITLADLARQLGGELEGDGHVVVRGIGPLHEAGPGEVSFLSNPKYEESLITTRAAGIIVSRTTLSEGKNLIKVDDPYLSFAKTMEIFYERDYKSSGISPHSFVHEGSKIGVEPSIHPFAVVCEGAVIGDRVTIMSGACVGPGSNVGDDSVLHPNVILERDVNIGKRAIIHAGTIVGSDGFGFAREGEKHHKVIHVGSVKVGDDVEIGAGCTIDRGVMGETVIGDGTKLDNLIQVAHNVNIGKNCIIVAQVGISGSTSLGNNVVVAGQTGVAGHLSIGDGAVIAGKTVVSKDVPAGSQVAGIPAVEIGQWRRSVVMVKNLDTLHRRIGDLEKVIKRLREGEEKE